VSPWKLRLLPVARLVFIPSWIIALFSSLILAYYFFREPSNYLLQRYLWIPILFGLISVSSASFSRSMRKNGF
jgi:hypothetical protein